MTHFISKRLKGKFVLFMTGVLLTLYLFISSCENNPTSAPDKTQFSRDILPVLVQNCTYSGCHNSFDKSAGLDLTSWEAMMLNGSAFGSEIIPFSHKWSHLIQHINRDTNFAPITFPQMPLPRPPFTNGELLPMNIVSLLAQWINEGAKNDNGEIAFSNATKKVFVTNQSSDFIAVINIENNFLIRLVPVGSGGNTPAAPHNVEVDKQNRYFYTTLINEKYLEKFDAVTYEKVGRLYIGMGPAHVVITSDGTTGYVTNYDLSGMERFVKCFDTQTMTETATISDITMNATHGARLTRNGEYLLTVSLIGEYIQIIRTADNTVEETIPVAENVPPNGNGTGIYKPIALSISPDDRYAFITCYQSNEVRILDLNTRNIVAVISVGVGPIQSECTANGRWCYVANRNDNTVSVIDLNTFTVIKTIQRVGIQPHGVAITPDDKFVYVSCESIDGTLIHHPTLGSSKPGTTAIIDINAGHIKVKDVEMASFPAGVSITRY